MTVLRLGLWLKEPAFQNILDWAFLQCAQRNCRCNCQGASVSGRMEYIHVLLFCLVSRNKGASGSCLPLGLPGEPMVNSQQLRGWSGQVENIKVYVTLWRFPSCDNGGQRDCWKRCEIWPSNKSYLLWAQGWLGSHACWTLFLAYWLCPGKSAASGTWAAPSFPHWVRTAPSQQLHNQLERF
jgi:hypothetical protein